MGKIVYRLARLDARGEMWSHAVFLSRTVPKYTETSKSRQQKLRNVERRLRAQMLIPPLQNRLSRYPVVGRSDHNRVSLLSKLGVVTARYEERVPSRREVGAPAPLHVPTRIPAPDSKAHPGRFSNGLKEFMSQLEGMRRGTLLDIGPPWQDTLNFFIERGFKVYTEDLLDSWGGFLREEDQQSRLFASTDIKAEKAESVDTSPTARAERFLASNLHHAADTFDAVLLWDLLDYLDRETVTRVVAKLTTMVRSGGVMLAVFHMRMPEKLQRYRVLDGVNLELVTAAPLAQPQHIYQNREIQDLFQIFRSSKFFVGRDQLREGVFVK